MISLFLSFAMASGMITSNSSKVMKVDSYSIAFKEATSCPSQLAVIKSVGDGRKACVVSYVYVKEEPIMVGKKVVWIKVNECRIFLVCNGPR